MSAKPKKSASKLYAINASSSIISKILQITALVWVNQYLLRRIQPEEYAIYPIVLSLMVAGEIFSRIFTGGITRFIIEHDAKGDEEGVTRVVSSMVPLLGLASLVIGLLGALAVWKIDFLIQVDPLYLHDARIMLALLVFGVCISILSTPFVSGLYARQKFIHLNMVELGSEVLRIGLMAGLLIGVSTKVLWLVVASTVATVIKLSVQRVFTKRLIPATKVKLGAIDFQVSKKIMSFGAWTSTSGITGLLQRTGPFMLLNHFSTALEVTIFNLGRLIDFNIKRIVQAAGQPLEPAMVRKFANEGIDGLKELFYRGARYQLWILMLVVPPLVVFRDQIVTLYVGETYLAAGMVMLFYFAAYPFDYAGSMFYRVAHASGRVGEFYKIQLFSTVLSFLFMVWLVGFQGYGGVGISMAYFATSVLINVGFMWGRGLKMVDGTVGMFLDKILWRGCLPVLVSCAACWGLLELQSPGSWLFVFCYSAVSAVVYFLVIYLFCMTAADKAIVGNVVKSIRRKLGK